MSANTADALLANSSTRLPRWVNNALVIAIGISLALLALKFLPQPAVVAVAISSSASASKKQSVDPVQQSKAIIGAHLFGEAGAKVEDVEPTVAPVEVTKLNLKLAGVFAYTPQENAIAIISAGSAEQSAYWIGDKVSGETTLKEVHPEYVILSNRGKDEKLLLSDEAPIAMRPIPQAQSSDAGNNGGAGSDPNADVEIPTNPGQIRDMMARNPALLGRVVAAEPYQENGKLLGYRITPKQNPEILEAQGIVSGDVITRVNNIQLNSQKQGIRALRNAVKADNLEIVVLRDGVEVPLSISLAQ
ncbi:MAG: type II secretion system protein GspC [Granulosicoccaceae bacterium]